MLEGGGYLHVDHLLHITSWYIFSLIIVMSPLVSCILIQINLYLLSRIILGLVKLGVKKGYMPEPKFDVFPWFAALMWGTVLFLFENHQETLQQSLQSSMTYIYHDSAIWNNVLDFLLYNSDSMW